MIRPPPNVSRAPRAPVLACFALIVAAGCAPVYTSASTSPSIEGVATRSEPERAEGPVAERVEPEPGERTVDLGLAGVLGTLVWPLPVLRASSLTSAYGFRLHPVRGGNRFHAGLDIRSPRGAPIYAAADGTVTSTGTRGAYGRRVAVDHGAGLSSLYAHASKILVEVGDRVRRGEPIARVGATGNATGPHLHFELRWGGGTVDPRTVLPPLADTSRIHPGR